MGLKDYLNDFKNILLGKTEDVEEPSFKDEIKKVTDNKEMKKASAAELIETRKNVEAKAKDMDKKILSSISLEDGRTATSYDEARKKNEAIKAKKRKQEEMNRQSAKINEQQAEKAKVKTQKSTVKDAEVKSAEAKPKKAPEGKKLQIDRKKLQIEMEKSEIDPEVPEIEEKN